MATKKIEYEDKVDLQIWGSVPDKNKVKAEDMNEIKDVVNNNEKELVGTQTKLEKVEKEFDDYAIHGQASGEFIHLTDSAKSSCKIEIKGNVKQEIRKGINRCDRVIGNVPKTYKSPATSYVATNAHFDDKFVEEWKENGFTIKVKAKNVLSKGAFTRFILDDTWNKRLEYSKFSKRTKDGYNIYESYVTDTNYNLFSDKRFIIAWEDHSEQTGCDLYAIEIDLGNTVGQDLEKYGASPSLDYPAPIQTVKDSVKVTSCNANVLDLTTLTAVNTIECTTENKKENEITLTSTNKTGASYVRFKGKVKAGTWYVKKEFEVLSGTGTNYTGRVFIQDADWNNVLVLNKNLKEGSFTLEEDKELYITLIAKETTDTSTEVIKIRFYNLMISKDDVDFVKHEQNSVTVPIQQEMLINDYLDKINKKEAQNYKKIILDETQNYTLLTTTENYLRFMLDLSKTSNLKNGFKVYCENLKVVKQTTSNSVNEEKIIERDISLDKQLQIVILKSRLAEATANGLKQYLATNNIVAYCELEEPTKLDLTQEQIEALEKLDEMQTYKNITNITTDSIAILDVDYKKDLETWQKQQDDRITALEELLNTTQTSAMLIENLENDLLKEVE